MFKGKNVCITGCNRGIGKALVTKFLENGANLICCIRKLDQEFLNYTKSISKDNGKIIKILEFDLEDEEKMSLGIKTLYDEKINIDILINNAGIAKGSIFEMTSIKILKKVFQINFFSQVKLIQLVLRTMKKSKNGLIINIGSVSGIKPERGNTSYGSSKAALMFSSQILAQELKDYNIRVNSFAPTLTETDMVNEMDEKSKSSVMIARNLKRAYTADEVAEKILILASEKFKNINGKILTMENINGR